MFIGLGFPALLYFQSRSSDSSVLGCCLGIIIIVVLVIVASVASANSQAKTQAQAKATYEHSLTELKSDPANADLRQRTLQLGRNYSNLTRNKKGVTVFDEVALMNDISAACAGATSLPSVELSTPSSKASIEDRLSRLAELKIQGLIDEDEYKLRRQRILDEI